MTYEQQRHQRGEHKVPSDLAAPERNHYFYGKLLDVFQLELEQNYFNNKRWLLNRLIAGPGVVCGLRVELTDEGVVVMPGLAIDRCGREIVVARPSKPQPLPQLPDYEEGMKTREGYQGSRQAKRGSSRKDDHAGHYYCERPFKHVVLCYHECETDPVPAMAGDCETVALCASGSIREQYEIRFKDGFSPPRPSNFPRNAIENGEINYEAIVNYVTNGCRAFPDDCCLPLANIELKESRDGWNPEVDNSIRPIVYTNRLLFELIKSLVRNEETEDSDV